MRLLLLSILATPLPVMAAPPVAPVAAEDIVVTARATRCRLSGRQLAPALRGYRNGRAAQAPDSTLFFEVEPALRRAGLTGAALAVHARGRVTRLAPDARHRFLLPKLSGTGWELVGDCYGGALAIRPLVMSPGTSPSDRRLGDLRLQCEVGWRIAEATLAASPGTFVAAPAACRSSEAALYAASHRAIASGSVAHGAVSRPVVVAEDGFGYRVPLHDKRLPHAARVRLRFAD